MNEGPQTPETVVDSLSKISVDCSLCEKFLPEGLKKELIPLLKTLDFSKANLNETMRVKELYRRRGREIWDNVIKDANPKEIKSYKKRLEDFFEGIFCKGFEMDSGKILALAYKLRKEGYVSIEGMISGKGTVRYVATPEKAIKLLVNQITESLNKIDEFEISLREPRAYCGADELCDGCLGYTPAQLLELSDEKYRCQNGIELPKLLPEGKKPLYLCDDLRFFLCNELGIWSK